jgi:hypothetical protein
MSPPASVDSSAHFFKTPHISRETKQKLSANFQNDLGIQKLTVRPPLVLPCKARPRPGIATLRHGLNTNVVLRARDAQKLVLAKCAVEDMLERVRRAQSRSA